MTAPLAFPKVNCYVFRAFAESQLPAFKEKNPQLEVITQLNRSHRPLLKGLYSKNELVVCVKNMNPEDTLQSATRLRNALGRKVVKLKTRHVTKHPRVQGKRLNGHLNKMYQNAEYAVSPYCRTENKIKTLQWK
ncbi:54S ribosomal protein L51 [Forsythia ovata]|uniref:Large ribosomal subunit protein mL43 n=1 Tax=Forsythia ovata TaxID=205694 RepID=A0ABD1UY13_9LAMI